MGEGVDQANRSTDACVWRTLRELRANPMNYRFLPLALSALATQLSFGQRVISVPRKDLQSRDEYRRACIAEYERRIEDPKATGLLAQIAQDRKARPQVYADLVHRYLESSEGNPMSRGGLHAPNLRSEDVRPENVLPWCYLYLSPYRLGAANLWQARIDVALQLIGGPTVVEAIRIQVEETFKDEGVDAFIRAAQQNQFLNDALAFPEVGGLQLVADEIPWIRSMRIARGGKEKADDPLDQLLNGRWLSAEEALKWRAQTDVLMARTKDPEKLEILRRLRNESLKTGHPASPPTRR